MNIKGVNIYIFLFYHTITAVISFPPAAQQSYTAHVLHHCTAYLPNAPQELLLHDVTENTLPTETPLFK